MKYAFCCLVLSVAMLCYGHSEGAEFKLDLVYENVYGIGEMKEKAMSFVSNKIVENPSDVNYRYLLGVLNVPDNTINAKKEFLNVVKLAPSHFESLMNIGCLSDADKSTVGASESYMLKAIESSPNNPVGYNTLAVMYVKYGMFDEAVRILEKGIARITDDPSLYYNQSILLLENYDGKPEQVRIERNVKKALSLKKDSIYYVLLATYLLRSGDVDRAINIYLDGYDIGSGNQLFVLGMASAYGKAKKYELAIGTAKKGLGLGQYDNVIHSEIKEWELEAVSRSTQGR